MKISIRHISDKIRDTPSFRDHVRSRFLNIDKFLDITEVTIYIEKKRDYTPLSLYGNSLPSRGVFGWEAIAICTQPNGNEVAASSFSNDPHHAVDQIIPKLRKQFERIKAGDSYGSSSAASSIRDDANLEAKGQIKTSPPVIRIAWDPNTVSEFHYAEVVQAIADVIREEGGIGLQRVKTGGFGIPSSVGAPL